MSGANPEHNVKHNTSTVPSGSTEPTDASIIEDLVYWTFQLLKQGADPL